MSPVGKKQLSRFPFAVLGLVVAMFTTASILSQHFFERGGPEMPAGLPPPMPSMASTQSSGLFRVSALVGEVEALQNGQWYVVRAGHLLSSQDVIRTHGGASALLRRGSVEIELRENMDLRLDALEKETASLGLLRGGRMSANVGTANEHVEITARETHTTNMGAARFVVSMTPTGRVSVMASDGTARFESRGKQVLVAKGTESTAFPGHEPTDPEPIPEDLLLSVIWPEDDKTDGQAHVHGKAQASSQVRVNGRPTEVTTDGSFAATVPLDIGSTRVQVEAEDISGRKKIESKLVRRLPRPPTLQTSDEDLWKQ